MSKQIKVSDEVYARLKKVSESNYRPMGSQIEYFLDATGVQSGEVGKIALPQKTEMPKTSDLFPEKNIAEPSSSGALPTRDELIEQPCCSNELTPCRHWVWDAQTGEGYRNTLSGRFMEVTG